ncbi:hypothetical protein [Streptomyces sp. 1222.5]|uniref:hypothetical protein n=1 Tax=Streptomyces sp. 1222.5 TaxID=1881026 RepID=UPI003EB6A2C1
MSRKFPKKVRNEFKRQQAAAEAFVETWTDTGLAWSLITDYSCTLTCSEAEKFAGLMRAFKYTETAEGILADHGEDCDTPHYHQPQGVWTFTIEAHGPAVAGIEDAEWVIVADGKSGADAETRAETFLRNQLKKKYPGHFYVTVNEVENGTPSSMALYPWTDIRLAA